MDHSGGFPWQPFVRLCFAMRRAFHQQRPKLDNEDEHDSKERRPERRRSNKPGRLFNRIKEVLSLWSLCSGSKTECHCAAGVGVGEDSFAWSASGLAGFIFFS